MKDNELSFEPLANSLLADKIASDPSEIHGILCGMLAGGMHFENPDWLASMSDFVNSGDSFSPELKQMLQQLFEQSCQQFIDSEFSLILCLPDDSAPIAERAQSIINWVQGFLVGFGVQQEEQRSCSEEVKEALQDFAEISRMDPEMSEDEESEQALFEVSEYVRISAMLCFSELGYAVEPSVTSQRTLH